MSYTRGYVIDQPECTPFWPTEVKPLSKVSSAPLDSVIVELLVTRAEPAVIELLFVTPHTQEIALTGTIVAGNDPVIVAVTLVEVPIRVLAVYRVTKLPIRAHLIVAVRAALMPVKVPVKEPLSGVMSVRAPDTGPYPDIEAVACEAPAILKRTEPMLRSLTLKSAVASPGPTPMSQL
jgi:hypothetical protein